MKIDPPLVVPVPLTSLASGRLGEIIAERTAGLPPEQRNDIAQRTIIEVLITQPEVPLSGMLRRHVALELERLWLPKGEQTKIYRQRWLQPIESVIFLAKRTRKNKGWLKVGAPKPQSTSLEAVADLFGFQSVAALKQFLKRERRAMKKRRS
jgi:hypothetical protein